MFPQLALGLSGFETGVSMMPLVRGDEDDDPERPEGRIRNTRKMLLVAALIMSFYLLTTSFVTSVLISAQEFEQGASDRALAYLAHEYLGNVFGTIYDISTMTILWFAGASAMAGLLNIVPRYLPRYGMSPEWGRAVRPLVLVYTTISVIVTIIFAADVHEQAGAYATGVLAMMTSAAFAVTLTVARRGRRIAAVLFGLTTVVFVYALVANVYKRPDGITIALFFIGAIVVISLVSRVQRSTELRQERIDVDEKAQEFIEEAAERGEIHLVAHRRRYGTKEEYERKEREQREDNHIPSEVPILFLEVQVEDASEFMDVLEVRGVEVGGHKVLRSVSSVVPNAIAAFLLHLRDTTGRTPHCYFGWTEGNPIVYLIRYMLFGEGDTAPVTHEVLQGGRAEPGATPRYPRRRPMSRQFVVVGLGRLGISMVATLDSLEHEVLGIDKREDVIQAVADDLPNVNLVAADATDEKAMRGLNVDSFDAAAVMIGEDHVEAGILATATLKEVGVPKIVARATGGIHARVLETGRRGQGHTARAGDRTSS